MKQKPITTRERKLMKIAFEAGRKKEYGMGLASMIYVHGNFKHFIRENKFVPGYLLGSHIIKI